MTIFQGRQPIQGQKLFKGGKYSLLGGYDHGNYSREETIQGPKVETNRGNTLCRYIHMYCHHNLILMFQFLENTAAFILKLKRFQTEAWQSWMHAILAQWQLLRSNCKGYIHRLRFSGKDIL